MVVTVCTLVHPKIIQVRSTRTEARQRVFFLIALPGLKGYGVRGWMKREYR